MNELEAHIANRAVLQHPFYQAWNQGTLTREALQDYATQYYHHVAAFPTYLSAVHSHTNDLEARRLLLENLMDEEAGSPNHPELWLDFAEGMGVSREAVLNAKLEPETVAAIEAFRTVCHSPVFTDGVSALYSYESQIPEVAQTKINGLVNRYDVKEEKTLRYFAVHVEADEVHRAQESALLESHVTTPAAQESALVAADTALNAIWNLLSGVCERHNITCH
jgi:pyrroloquinoline-quinone synthase